MDGAELGETHVEWRGVLTVLAMGLAMYTLRVAGLVVTVPPGSEHALRFVPVAMLTALVASSLAGGAPDTTVARGLALVVGGLAVWRTRRLWACIVLGLAVYYALRWPI